MNTVHLLLVEHEPELRERLSEGLGQAGFDVHAASDASAAMRPTERAPDAMVIDVDLPDADGRDLSRALRARGTSLCRSTSTARTSSCAAPTTGAG